MDIMQEKEGQIKPLAVYVHWPFCVSKCPYCDFNSHVAERIDHEQWRDAYVREIDYYADMLPTRRVTSIFFGGGTPSLMKPSVVGDIIAHIQKRWQVSNDVEITLEANPTSIEAQKFQDFKMAGVTRVSVGVQALNDADLKFLGRGHSAAQALGAIDIATKTFDRFSFDLIYARPQQTLKNWEEELRQALSYAGGHLSLYQLTIENGTPFFAWHERGDFKIPESDAAADLYELTQDIMNAHGMPAYEISNHATPYQESAHNMTYWRYGDYVGIGPGAHGRLTIAGEKCATRAHRAPDIWLSRVAAHGHGAHPFDDIQTAERFSECLMMGLRLAEGVNLKTLCDEVGAPWQNYMAPAKVDKMIAEGFMVLSQNHLQATAAGRQRLNALLAYLL